MDLKKYIRDIPDFPKKGIIFKDITPLLQNPASFRATIRGFAKRYRNQRIKKVVSMDARGFIFGSALAVELNAGFVPVRKKGKLPWKTIAATYELEYGTDTLEIHKDAVLPGERVLILDDLLATGGTAKAVVDLVKKLKGIVVEIACVIELTFLNGKKKVKGTKVYSLIQY
ncbi:MAG: adenine phosphoribosyltransferase [Elusimicrobiota bacterium]